MKEEMDFKINVDKTELEETKDILSEMAQDAESLDGILNVPENTFRVENNRNVYITVNNFNQSHKEYLKD